MSERLQLWEILVPTHSNDGAEIDVTHHQQWDERVRRVAGGLTILRTAKGQWQSADGELYSERMIPVRVACSREQIEEIIDMTLAHYNDQLAVMAHRVSNEVIIRNRAD